MCVLRKETDSFLGTNITDHSFHRIHIFGLRATNAKSRPPALYIFITMPYLQVHVLQKRTQYGLQSRKSLSVKHRARPYQIARSEALEDQQS